MQSFLGVEIQLYLGAEFVTYLMIVRQELFVSAVPKVSYQFVFLSGAWKNIFINKSRVLIHFINSYIQFLHQSIDFCIHLIGLFQTRSKSKWDILKRNFWNK